MAWERDFEHCSGAENRGCYTVVGAEKGGENRVVKT